MLAWFAAATAGTAVILGGALCPPPTRGRGPARPAGTAGVPGRDPAWAAVEQPCGAVAVAARDP